MSVAPDNFQGIIPGIAQFDRMDIIGNRFRSKHANTCDFIDTDGTRAFAPEQFEGDTKHLTIRPRDLEQAFGFECSKGLRWHKFGHKYSFISL